MSTSTDELRDKVVAGEATADEIETFLGPDLMNAGVHQLRGEHDSRYAFQHWYRAVIEPIDLDRVAAWKMFIGQTSIEDFADGLTDAEAGRFVEMFPELQAAHQRSLDDGSMVKL